MLNAKLIASVVIVCSVLVSVEAYRSPDLHCNDQDLVPLESFKEQCGEFVSGDSTTDFSLESFGKVQKCACSLLSRQVAWTSVIDKNLEKLFNFIKDVANANSPGRYSTDAYAMSSAWNFIHSTRFGIERQYLKLITDFNPRPKDETLGDEWNKTVELSAIRKSCAAFKPRAKELTAPIMHMKSFSQNENFLSSLVGYSEEVERVFVVDVLCDKLQAKTVWERN